MFHFFKNNKFFIAIFLSIFIGYIAPPIYSFKILIPILLGISLLFSFLKMDFSSFSRGEKTWILKSSFWRFLIAPVIIFPIAKYFLSNNFMIGYVILSISPTGLGSVLLSSKTKYDSKIIAFDVIVQNILAIILIPIIASLLFGNNQNYSKYLPLFTRISSMIFIPLIISTLIKKIIPMNTLKNINTKTGKFNTIAIISIIFVAANIAFGRLKESNSSFIEPLIFAFSLATINYISGYLLTKDKNKKLMTSMSLGYRNTSLVIWIMINFFNPIGSLPAVFYIISQHFFNINILIKSKKMK